MDGGFARRSPQEFLINGRAWSRLVAYIRDSIIFSTASFRRAIEREPRRSCKERLSALTLVWLSAG